MIINVLAIKIQFVSDYNYLDLHMVFPEKSLYSELEKGSNSYEQT